jgi:hypothetical protein
LNTFSQKTYYDILQMSKSKFSNKLNENNFPTSLTEHSEMDAETLAAYADLSHLELIRDGFPSYSAVRQGVHVALTSINVPADVLLSFYDKLKLYRHRKDDDIEEGRYARWIDLEKVQQGTFTLANGGIVCGFKPTHKGTGMLCKSRVGNMFTIPLYRSIVFQQMSDSELLVSKAIDYLERSK